jgi:uncharacterized protein (TIGR02145 family)
MRGYFYQVGRNIPYKTYPLLQYAADDPNAADVNNTCHTYTRSDKSLYYWVQSEGDLNDDKDKTDPYNKDKGRYLYPYIPGLWETIPARWNYASFTLRKEGQKGDNASYSYYTGVKLYFYKEDKTPTNMVADRVLVESSDNPGKYLYLTIPSTIPSGTDLTTEYMSQFLAVNCRKSNSWTATNSSGLWDANISPCPPGWRIPTDNEWKGIVPIDQLTGDITYMSNNHTFNGTDFWYQEKSDDPSNGYQSIYYGNMPQKRQTGKTKQCGDIYIIKKVGQSSAYGLHIWVDKTLTVVTNSKDSIPDSDPDAVNARCVLVIDRYTFSKSPAKATFNQDNPPSIDKTGMINSFDSNVKTDTTRQKIYWYKVETLTFPICGVGHYDSNALIWSGTETQYATKEGHWVRMKIAGSTGSRYVQWENSTYHNCIIPIRPVRDETAISW